jgi:predicted SnoaL-like aldol condensation-catalyzing enzyme
VAPDAMNSRFIDNRGGRGNTPSMTTDNKAVIQRALAALLETRDVDALAPFLSDDFIHRRPDSTSSTKAEWLAAVRAALVPLADMRVEVLQLLADGDHVVLCTRRWLPGGPEITVVEVWRVRDGLIAEGFEIIEPVSRSAANLTWWEPASR